MNELQVFKYTATAEVRTVIKDGAPWFVLKDVCDVLGLSNPTVVAARLDADEVTKFDLGGLSGEINIVNEPGLYNVILRSDKPEAKAFKRWVTHEVLPAIRKYGLYATPGTVEEMLDELQKTAARRVTLREIAEITGAAYRTVARYAKKAGWTKNGRQTWLDENQAAILIKSVEATGGQDSKGVDTSQSRAVRLAALAEKRLELEKQFNAELVAEISELREKTEKLQIELAASTNWFSVFRAVCPRSRHGA